MVYLMIIFRRYIEHGVVSPIAHPEGSASIALSAVLKGISASKYASRESTEALLTILRPYSGIGWFLTRCMMSAEFVSKVALSNEIRTLQSPRVTWWWITSMAQLWPRFSEHQFCGGILRSFRKLEGTEPGPLHSVRGNLNSLRRLFCHSND